MPVNGPISFMVGLEGLIAQLTTEAELVAAAQTMKEAVFCKGMLQELGFKGGFNIVLLLIDNMSPLHVAYSPRASHITVKYFFIQKLIKVGTITIHYAKTQDNLLMLGPSISTSIVTGNFNKIRGLGTSKTTKTLF